jgi:EAL domain-containing protein (putative c-di-GMP-specific phosphodiesterase class I)
VLTGSIGIAVYDGQQTTPADLLREAETAMYRAKRSGADRIELYKPEMRGERDDRTQIETDLKQAIEKRQIRVYYQPVMRLGDDQLAGFEAVVRWEHPKHGVISTAEFLPIAEELGIIGELSGYVMERAVRQVARWHRTLPRDEDPLFVSINIASRHLFKQELVQDLRLMIGRESVPKGCLRLEVTESLIMENPEQAIEILDWLKGLGAGLSLDEFGAGYSSLSYLHRLAVDTIKIDRSLVAQGNDNKSGGVILRAALAMARELGKDVVAVGIEREDDVAYLRALSCDYAQGFYFGEAMSEREVMGLLNALARSSKRDEKKKRKDKKLQEFPPEAAVAAEDGHTALSAPAGPPEEVRSGLPVPAAASIRIAAKKKSGNPIRLFETLGRLARAPVPTQRIAASVRGLMRSVTGGGKTTKRPKRPDAKMPAPDRPDTAAAPSPPQSLSGRLSRLDPNARRPRPPGVPGVEAGPPPPPDYADMQGQRERRRRGHSTGA